MASERRNVIDKAFYANLAFAKLSKKRDDYAKKRGEVLARFKEIAKKIRDSSSEDKSADNQALFGELLLCRKKLDATARYSTVRKRSFCRITGRKRGLQLGMDRAYLRNMCGFGVICGVKKF